MLTKIGSLGRRPRRRRHLSSGRSSSCRSTRSTLRRGTPGRCRSPPATHARSRPSPRTISGRRRRSRTRDSASAASGPSSRRASAVSCRPSTGTSTADKPARSARAHASRKLGRAAILGLLNSLDTDPSIGGVTTTASNSSTASLEFLYMPEELAADVPGRTPEFDPVSGTYLRRSVPIFNLHSRSFDNDWHRASRCKTLDDVGMRVSDWRGKFEGTWVGSFAYFDCASRASPQSPCSGLRGRG